MDFPKTARLACPRCNGDGFIEVSSEMIARDFRPWLRGNTRDIRNKLRSLKKENKLKSTLRQIAKQIGVKTAQQVKHHILMIDKIGWDKFE